MQRCAISLVYNRVRAYEDACVYGTWTGQLHVAPRAQQHVCRRPSLCHEPATRSSEALLPHNLSCFVPPCFCNVLLFSVGILHITLARVTSTIMYHTHVQHLSTHDSNQIARREALLRHNRKGACFEHRVKHGRGACLHFFFFFLSPIIGHAVACLHVYMSTSIFRKLLLYD